MTEMVKNSSVDYLALINGTALYQRPNAGLQNWGLMTVNLMTLSV
ncbi:MAG: hypothetical protein R2867_10980 [Caldilineaceae bacterium]